MKFTPAVCLVGLLLSTVTVLAVPAPRPAGGVRRKAVYNSNAQMYNDRVARAQVDTRLLRRYKADPLSNILRGKQRRQNDPSSTPTESCRYNGVQPETSQCQDTDTSNGCTTEYYVVDPTYVQLEDGYTFMAGGHVNFQYIPLSQYQGFGSYSDPDPNWTISSGGLNFDPNKGQPGAVWIGRDYFDWSAGADLPEDGYCIVWVQIDGFNPHYGEGGQGPVCYCPLSSRRRFRY